MPKDGMVLFSGNSNPELVTEILNRLEMSPAKAVVGRFSDGEIMVEVNESVRGKDVYIIQSTSQPTNDNLMELLVLIDAVRWASAKRITAVIPYFGYARQDRRSRSARVPLTARLVAKQIALAGAHRVMTMDLHADQIQGFFDIPVDNMYALPILLGDVWRKKLPNLMVVSPDVGGVVRARAIAKLLDDCDLAIIDKRRPKANVAKVMNIIGDVKGRDCVLIDDLVDTAGTLCKAAAALKEHGATSVVAYCTHPVLSGPAVENIQESVLDELVVTNTVRLQKAARECSKIRQISVAELLAESISLVASEQSISGLFMQ